MVMEKSEGPGEGRSSVLSVRVDNETYDGFRRCVEAEGGTVSASIRDAMESFLDRARRRENDELDVERRTLTQKLELDVAGDVLDDTEELSMADEGTPAGDVVETVAQVGLGALLGAGVAWALGLFR
ncbi:unnamed protein product [marine sediment metagenome]|uniref:Uncharacterized protein n=1 Tax=marine sediment metagenome TaxID=412755 RepID=X1QQN0_9ZZZZ